MACYIALAFDRIEMTIKPIVVGSERERCEKYMEAMLRDDATYLYRRVFEVESESMDMLTWLVSAGVSIRVATKYIQGELKDLIMAVAQGSQMPPGKTLKERLE